MEHQFRTCSEPLAITSVPTQNWCNPYPWKTALYEGTIFPCLNLLFLKPLPPPIPLNLQTIKQKKRLY